MKKVILAAAISAVIAPVAYATDPMMIVITASRTEQAQADVSTPITVITKQDIEQQQPKSVAEALASAPGIQIKSSGGYGQQSSLFLRGIDQKRMLVLVDGVQIGSATLGTASLEHIPVDQIERIEVVRGARSSLYGANAIGGVIQIFTKKPKQEQSYGEVLAGYGSNNAMQSAVSGGWSNSQSQVTAKVSHFSTDGFNVIPANTGGGIDDDGYTNNALKLDGQHIIGLHTLTAGIKHTTGEYDYDNTSGSNNAKAEFEFTSIYAGVTSKLTETFTLTSKLSTHKDKSENFSDGVGFGNYVTKTQKLEIQGEQRDANGLLIIAGIDYKKDDVSGSTQTYDKEIRDNKALFALIEKSGDNYQAALSARFDDNEAFGHFTTYGIDGRYDLTPQVSVSASYATAFLAPTFNQLYWPSSGNADLKPETSDTTSLGVDYRLSQHLDFALNLYQTQLEDMISGWPAQNTDKAEIKGIELMMNASFDNTQLMFNANLLETEDKKTGKKLDYRAEKTANLTLSQTLDNFILGGDVQYVGERTTNSAFTPTLDSYSLVNLNLSYALQRDLLFSFNVKNVLDKKYVSNTYKIYDNSYTYHIADGDYATAGRTIFGSIRYRF